MPVNHRTTNAIVLDKAKTNLKSNHFWRILSFILKKNFASPTFWVSIIIIPFAWMAITWAIYVEAGANFFSNNGSINPLYNLCLFSPVIFQALAFGLRIVPMIFGRDRSRNRTKIYASLGINIYKYFFINLLGTGFIFLILNNAMLLTISYVYSYFFVTVEQYFCIMFASLYCFIISFMLGLTITSIIKNVVWLNLVISFLLLFSFVLGGLLLPNFVLDKTYFLPLAHGSWFVWLQYLTPTGCAMRITTNSLLGFTTYWPFDGFVIISPIVQLCIMIWILAYKLVW